MKLCRTISFKCYYQCWNFNCESLHQQVLKNMSAGEVLLRGMQVRATTTPEGEISIIINSFIL